MKNKPILLVCCVVLFATLAFSFHRSKQPVAAEPWTPAQLESPQDLASIINDPKAKQPIILCVGPGAIIKGSIDIGPTKDSANMAKTAQPRTQCKNRLDQ